MNSPPAPPTAPEKKKYPVNLPKTEMTNVPAEAASPAKAEPAPKK